MQVVSIILPSSDIANSPWSLPGLRARRGLHGLPSKNNAKFATSTCDGCEQCVDNSPRVLHYSSPSLRVPLITATISCSGLLHLHHSYLQVQQHIRCYSFQAPLASNREKDRLQDRPHNPTRIGAAPEVSVETVSSCWLSRRSMMSPVGFSWWLRHSEAWLQPFGLHTFAVSGPQIWNSLPLFSKFPSSASSTNSPLIYW